MSEFAQVQPTTCDSLRLEHGTLLVGGPGPVGLVEHAHADVQVTLHLPRSASATARIIPSWVSHAGAWAEDTVSVVFHLTPGLIDTTADELLGTGRYELVAGYTDDPLIAHLGAAIAVETRESWRDSVFLDSAMHVLAGALVRRHARITGQHVRCTERLSAAQLRRLRELIESRFDDPPSLSEVASAVGLGPQRLARLLKQATGVGPHGYLIRLRLDKAKRLLREGSMPLAQMALVLGFSSQSHFTSTFRRQVGVTPSEYRRHIRGSAHGSSGQCESAATQG